MECGGKRSATPLWSQRAPLYSTKALPLLCFVGALHAVLATCAIPTNTPSLLWIENAFHGILFLWMSDSSPQPSKEHQYPNSELVRRLLGLAWQFRADCLLSLTL